MKLDVLEDGTIRLQEVYNSVVFQIHDGQRFAVCMRDDGLDIGVIKDDETIWGHVTKNSYQPIGQPHEIDQTWNVVPKVHNE